MGLRSKIKGFINASIDVEFLQARMRNSKIKAMEKQCVLGKNTKLFAESAIDNLSKKPENIVLGESVICRGQLLIFSYAGKITVGNNVFIGEGTRIWSGSPEGIKIGNNVLISHNVFIGDTNSHELDYNTRSDSFTRMITEGHPKENPGVATAPVVIEDNVWLSFNVIIMKGVTIGKGSIIGAGAIVVNDVPPFSLVVGQSAKIIKTLEH